MPDRVAYLPLDSYPEAVADAAVLACVELAGALGCALHTTAFSVDIPPVGSPMGGMLLNLPGLVRTAEDKSRAESARLQALVATAAGSRLRAVAIDQQVILGGAPDAAAVEARYFDLALLPWSDETATARDMARDMAQALIFGSGRPVIVVPPVNAAAPIDHIAIAWDESRVAARALGDALPLLAAGGRVSVLSVLDEKPLAGADLAQTLVAVLKSRGVAASAVGVPLAERTISEALQETALSEGAQVLAMGGFGHSRLRDFILGGATRGVLSRLRLPVLMSH